MDPARAVEVLNVIAEHDARDPEVAHGLADDVLLAVVPDEVADAYRRVISRAKWRAAA